MTNSKRHTALHTARVLTIIAAGLPIFIATALAGDIRTERVQFKKGEIGATINDRIKGYEGVDYKLGAREGQTMIVMLETDNPSNYFNVLAPGETDVAMFIGSNEGNRFEGELPRSGDYTIRVYLYRNAARRGETANYKLDVSIAAAGDVPSEANRSADAGNPGNDALVAGTDFNATGEIPCARVSGQPMASCRFGVRREGQGTAQVTVFWPDGGSRVIFFEDGAANGSDASEADGGGPLEAKRESDLNLIRIGDERFEIPDAVIYGG